jgi:hypothetical protein
LLEHALLFSQVELLLALSPNFTIETVRVLGHLSVDRREFTFRALSDGGQVTYTSHTHSAVSIYITLIISVYLTILNRQSALSLVAKLLFQLDTTLEVFIITLLLLLLSVLLLLLLVSDARNLSPKRWLF